MYGVCQFIEKCNKKHSNKFREFDPFLMDFMGYTGLKRVSFMQRLNAPHVLAPASIFCTSSND